MHFMYAGGTRKLNVKKNYARIKNMHIFMPEKNIIPTILLKAKFIIFYLKFASLRKEEGVILVLTIRISPLSGTTIPV